MFNADDIVMLVISAGISGGLLLLIGAAVFQGFVCG